MTMNARCLVGLDVHARQTHAAVLDACSGELQSSRLRVAPIKVVSFLEARVARAELRRAAATA